MIFYMYSVNSCFYVLQYQIFIKVNTTGWPVFFICCSANRIHEHLFYYIFFMLSSCQIILFILHYIFLINKCFFSNRPFHFFLLKRCCRIVHGGKKASLKISYATTHKKQKRTWLFQLNYLTIPFPAVVASLSLILQGCCDSWVKSSQSFLFKIRLKNTGLIHVFMCIFSNAMISTQAVRTGWWWFQ